ncbi:MAG: hypothetical protein ACEPO8_11425 [Rhodothermaceae bacterium]
METKNKLSIWLILLIIVLTALNIFSYNKRVKISGDFSRYKYQASKLVEYFEFRNEYEGKKLEKVISGIDLPDDNLYKLVININQIRCSACLNSYIREFKKSNLELTAYVIANDFNFNFFNQRFSSKSINLNIKNNVELFPADFSILLISPKGRIEFAEIPDKENIERFKFFFSKLNNILSE